MRASLVFMKYLFPAVFSLFGLIAMVLGCATAMAEDLTNEKRAMESIGFQQFQEASRVFVKTTEAVTYRIDTSRPLTVILILENTKIPLKNNKRILPVAHFDSPIYKITPKVMEGPSPTTHIEIQLRRAAKLKQVQTDNFLALDFTR